MEISDLPHKTSPKWGHNDAHQTQRTMNKQNFTEREYIRQVPTESTGLKNAVTEIQKSHRAAHQQAGQSRKRTEGLGAAEMKNEKRAETAEGT